MIHSTTTIINNLGLHARASAKLSKLAGSFPCEVWISKGERRVNAKSIMGVMMLAAGIGTQVVLDTEGEREQEAMDAMLALIADRFGEGEWPLPSTAWLFPVALPLGGRCWWRPAGSMLHITSLRRPMWRSKSRARAPGVMR